MKKILTDSRTNRKFTILFENPYLPALGEDGIKYYVFTNNLFLWGNVPRDDCDVLDLKEKIGIKAVKYPSRGITEPSKYIFDKESFDRANTINEYVELLKNKGLI